MPTCFACECELISIKALLKHFGDIHDLTSRFCEYICAKGLCGRRFGDKFAYDRHLRDYHDCNDNADKSVSVVQVAEENVVCDTRIISLLRLFICKLFYANDVWHINTVHGLYSCCSQHID